MSVFSALTSRISARKLPPGRRAFAMKHMLGVAKKNDLCELVEDLQEAIAWERHTIRLEVQWEAVRGKRYVPRGNASAIDKEIDQQVAAVETVARGHSVGKDHEPKVKAARSILKKVFPSGVAAITRQPFEIQLERVDLLVDVLEDKLANEVRTLGLGSKVELLKALSQEFRVELEVNPEPLITFAKVRAARDEGHERFIENAAFILGHFRKRTPEDTAIRTEFFSEWERQDAAVVEERRKKRAVRDVDPDTGEVLESAVAESPEGVDDDAVA